MFEAGGRLELIAWFVELRAGAALCTRGRGRALPRTPVLAVGDGVVAVAPNALTGVGDINGDAEVEGGVAGEEATFLGAPCFRAAAFAVADIGEGVGATEIPEESGIAAGVDRCKDSRAPTFGRMFAATLGE